MPAQRAHLPFVPLSLCPSVPSFPSLCPFQNMLILTPSNVTFGSFTFSNISSIMIDRASTRRIIEWSDDGPHPVFVDCPEQRITITAVQELAQGELSSPIPGTSATLSFSTAHNRSAAGWSRITVPAVLVAITHDSKPRGFIRSLSFIAVSPRGDSDPISIAPLN